MASTDREIIGKPGGTPVASVGVYLDSGPRDSLIRSQQIRFAIFANLGLLGLLVVLYFSINRLLIHPIKELTHATKQIGYPDWHKPLGIKRHDEIGDLANAYDEMIESLNTRDEEVKLLHRLAGRQSCFTYTQYYCMETGYW